MKKILLLCLFSVSCFKHIGPTPTPSPIVPPAPAPAPHPQPSPSPTPPPLPAPKPPVPAPVPAPPLPPVPPPSPSPVPPPVVVPPTVSLPLMYKIHKGDSVTLQVAPVAGVTYFWSTGDKGPLITVTPTADASYSVHAANAGGVATATVAVVLE